MELGIFEIMAGIRFINTHVETGSKGTREKYETLVPHGIEQEMDLWLNIIGPQTPKGFLL